MSPCTQCVNQRLQVPRTVLTQLLWDWKTRWGVYSRGFIVSWLTCVFNISACYAEPKSRERAVPVTPVQISGSVNFPSPFRAFVSRAWTNRTGGQRVDKKTQNVKDLKKKEGWKSSCESGRGTGIRGSRSRRQQPGPVVLWSVHLPTSECCHIKSLSERVSFQHINSHVPHSETYINNPRPIMPHSHAPDFRHLVCLKTTTTTTKLLFLFTFYCFHFFMCVIR